MIGRRLLEVWLFLTIAFAVIAFGATPAWARSVFSMAAFIAAIAALWICRRRPDPGRRPVLVAWSILLIVPLLQLTPLPAAVQRVISPVHAQVMSRVQATGLVDPRALHTAVSIFPGRTVEQFLLFAALAAVFWVGRELLRDAGARRRLSIGLIVLASGETCFGLLQYLGKIPHIFLAPGREVAEVASGTYINRNHFAGFLEMAFPVVIALAYGLFYARIRPAIDTYSGRWRKLFTHPRTPVFTLLLFTGAWLCLGLIFSMSRGGILAMLLTVAFLSVLTAMRHSRRRIQLVALLFVLLVGGYAVWLGLDPVLTRFERIMDEEGVMTEGRLPVWKDTVDLIRDFPLLGVGLGNYRYAFLSYNETPMNVVYDHAHNDFLQYTAELGIPAGFTLIAFVLAAVFFACRGFIRTPSVSRQAALLGAAGGVFSILAHSVTDFNLQIPANTALFTMLLAAISAVLAEERAAEESAPADDSAEDDDL
ncbi:MAG TPA: O-antigen ligase family protein [Acidobacteriota bacterium]|nr:O-antigen ligase family protein [Acidobacteriota bacterium]HQG91314.1 O-antigen ligase family protein [Acidobacteriota bacterium]HQK87721.1 O-antigen ligase family protein [Acidobacteriota bacterium]